MINNNNFQDDRKQVLFDEFTIQDLYKQIVTNTRQNRYQIKSMLKSLQQSIQNTMDLQIFIAQIQKFMNTLVKNDQMLLKLANVVTKVSTQRQKLLQQSGQNTLTQSQKKFIMQQAKKQLDQIVKFDTNIKDIDIKKEKGNKVFNHG